MTEQLVFPNPIEEFKTVVSMGHMRQLINKKKDEDLENAYRIKFKSFYKDDKIYVLCRVDGCKACFTYHKQEELNMYVMHRYKNVHNHQKQPKKPQVTNKILQTIKTMESSGLNVTARMISENFNCKRSTYYYAKKVIKTNEERNFSCLFHKMKKQNITFRCSPALEDFTSGTFPQIFIIMTENMKQKYKKYGECIYIDVFNSMCSQTMNDKPLSLVFFFGLNCYKKLVIFGFALTQEKDKKTLYRIMKTYFLLHEKQMKTKSIFVFDNKKDGIREALLELVEDNVIASHVFIDRTVLLKSNNIIFSDAEKNSLLIEASEAQNIHDFGVALANISSNWLNGEDKPIFERIRKYRNQFCFYFYPKVFINGNTGNSLNIKLSIELLKKLKYDNYIKTLLQVIEQSNEINNRSLNFNKRKFKYYLPYQFDCLKRCNKYLSEEVLVEVQKQFGKAVLNMISLVPKSEPQTFLVTNAKTSQQFTICSSNYKCECGYFEKTYIPCNHSIAVLSLKKQDIFEHVGSFYKQQLNDVDIVTNFPNKTLK